MSRFRRAIFGLGCSPILLGCYDPLGLVSAMTLQAKMIFREVCESKISWDAPLPDKQAKLWDNWDRVQLTCTRVYETKCGKLPRARRRAKTNFER